jgi:hypothetical protein
MPILWLVRWLVKWGLISLSQELRLDRSITSNGSMDATTIAPEMDLSLECGAT